MRVALLGLALLATLLAGCARQEQPTEPIAAVVTVAQGTVSGVHEQLWGTIRDAETWRLLWERHAAAVPGAGDVPEVDFTREMVFVYFDGDRPTAGYQVEITEIRDRGELLVALVEERGPPPGSMVAQVLTQPYHIVRLPRRDQEITLSRYLLPNDQ